MTPLPCPACGATGSPGIEPGTGPHVAKAVCRGCGRFLKWLPRVLVEKEMGMQPSVNRCILLGQVGRNGVEVSFVGGGGTAKASFMLGLTELGSDGREHFAFFPCEVWGKRAEAAGELAPGATVLVEGKLKRVKQGETWTTIISGWEAQVLTLPASTPATTEGSAW